VERLAGDMSGYEPEVSLAVRLPPSGGTEADRDDDEDDEAEIDEFLSSNGFEFIDASTERSSESEEELGPFSQGSLTTPQCIFLVDGVIVSRYPRLSSCTRRSQHHHVALYASAG
jgi:hypothetical protein